MSCRFYITLVRHGETLENRENIIQGQADTQLSDLGRQQACLVAQRLRNEHFTHMYTSDLSRAADTAKAIVAANETSNCQLKSDKRLRERSFGDMEGKKFNDFHTLVKELNLTPQTYTPKNGEKVEQVSARARLFFKDICEMISTSSEDLNSDKLQSSLEDINAEVNSDGQCASSVSAASAIPDNSLSNGGRGNEPLTIHVDNCDCELTTSNGSPVQNETQNSDLESVGKQHILIVSHGLLLRELKRLILDRYKGALMGENASQAHRISPNTGVSKFALIADKVGRKVRVSCTDCYVINCSDHLRLSDQNLVSEAKYQGSV